MLQAAIASVPTGGTDNTVSKRVSEILRRFTTYKSNVGTKEYREQISSDMKFTTPGGQWEQSQVDALESRGQAPIEINIIEPQIEQQKAQLLGKPPQFKVIPVTDEDVGRAQVMSRVCDYIWYRNQAELVTDEVVTNQLEVGKGYFYCWWNPYGDNGRGLITIESVHPIQVLVDPTSSRRDEEDAEAKFLYRYITFDAAKRRFPDLSDYIDRLPEDAREGFYEAGEESTEMGVRLLDELATSVVDDTTKTLLYAEQQTKVMERINIITYQANGITMTRELSDAELARFTDSIDVNNPNDAAMLMALQDAQQSWRERVQRIVILGTKELVNEILPTSRYTIIPVVNRHRGNPWPVGLSRKLRGLQQETNHRRSLIIAYASSGLSPKVMLPRGSVDNITRFEEDWNRPNAVVEYDPAFGEPHFAQPMPPPAALFQLDQVNKQDAQYLGGSFSLSGGDPSGVQDTPFRSTLLLDEMASRRPGLVAKNLYYALDVLGRVVVDFIQRYMKAPWVQRVVNPYDPNDTGETIALNTVYSDKDIQSIENVETGYYDVRVIVGSMTPNNRFAELETHRAMYKDGIIDEVEVLKKTDIYDREGVLKRRGMNAQLTQKISDLTQQNKMLLSELEDTRNKLSTAKIEVERAQADKALEKTIVDLQAQYNAKLLELERAVQELKLAKQEVKVKANATKDNQKVST
jgi:hypothetical protein